MIQKAAAISNWWLAAWSRQHTWYQILCRDFWWNIKLPKWLSPSTAQIWRPVTSDFPELKSPLKGKRLQTVDEIQENTMGQLMVIGRNVWGPKVPTLKGTEASLSHVRCFLYLLSSSFFHIMCLDTFWIDLVDEFLHIHHPHQQSGFFVCLFGWLVGF